MAKKSEDDVVTDSTQALSHASSSTFRPTTTETALPITAGSPPNGKQDSGASLSKEPIADDLPVKNFSNESRSSGEKSGIKSNSSRRPQLKYKPTGLTFRELEDEPSVAKCVLVLCNISEVPLQFRLKSSPGSNIVSVPFGNGHIAPHSQLRLTLTWTRSSNYKTWKEVPPPKMVLTTRFLDVAVEENDVTHTRLAAKIGTKKCSSANPPVEQLLLDAAGKQEEKLDLPPNVAGDGGLGQTIADFVNNLSDRGLCVLIVILGLFVLMFTGGRRE